MFTWLPHTPMALEQILGLKIGAIAELLHIYL